MSDAMFPEAWIAAGAVISLNGGADIVVFPEVWTVEDALEQIELMAERTKEIKAGLAAFNAATLRKRLKTVSPGCDMQRLAMAWTLGLDKSPDPHGVLYLKATIGSGRSFLGSHFACSRALTVPSRMGLIVLNSKSAINTLTTLVDFCQQVKVPIASGPDFVEAKINADPEWLAEKILQSCCCRIGSTYVSISRSCSLTEKTIQNIDPGWVWFDDWPGCDVASVYEFLIQAGEPNSSRLAFVSSANGHNDPSLEKIQNYLVEGS